MAEGTKYLGLDYGLKRVGVAVSDESKKYSFQRDYLLNDKDLHRKILELIRKENIICIVIGYPVNLKSGRTDLTEAAEKFKSSLENRLISNAINCNVVFFDERFTSSLAAHGLAMSGLRKSRREEKGLIDSISAQIILQDYIDFIKNKKPDTGV